MELEAK
jgi:hypothetical protein